MDRRGFLKYAAATATVAGASALGIEYMLETRSAGSNRASITSIRSTSSTAMTSIHTTDLKLTLFADWHGDGVQQSDEPAVADVQVEITGLDNEYKSVLMAESDGSYWARNIAVGKHYQVIPKSDWFVYVAISNAQFIATEEYNYVVDSREPSLHLGLMEGFLTLPLMPAVKYEVDRFYDWDANLDRYLWWNGQRGSDSSLKRGYSPNHYGIDYYMDEGSPLPSPAPGVVDDMGEDEGGKYVFIRHSTLFKTSCGHISKALVAKGDHVSRGQIIALSGKSGANTEAANYTHNHFQLIYKVQKAPYD